LEWAKIEIKTTSTGIEIVYGLLAEIGIIGVEIIDPHEMANFFKEPSQDWDYVDENISDSKAEDASIIFYTGTNDEGRKLLNKVEEEVARLKAQASNVHLGSLSIHVEYVNDQNWLHEWKKYFVPLEIGRVSIIPEWDKANHENEIIFRIDPGSAFGTGQHATTKLCIEILQEHIAKKDTVLDVGCGSGILSIISLLMGAQHVVGCDIDASAIEVTQKNAKLNPVDSSRLELYVGDVLANNELQQTILTKKYKLVIANIVADVIIKLAALIPNLLEPGGIFIASGIIDERLDETLHALNACGLSVTDIRKQDGWCALVANG